MSKAIFHKGSVPFIIWIKAICRWIPLFILDSLIIIIGIFIGPLIVLLLKKFDTNIFGEPKIIFNRDQYPNSSLQGWEFLSIDPKWKTGNILQRFLWLFGNEEDGALGDRRGWWSNNVKGKERNFWNKYWWLTIRNPANNASRYTKLYSCMVNDCNIEYWYDYKTPDDSPLVLGKHFVIATDRNTDHKYYGYRNVMTLFKKYTDSYTGWALNIVLGFKLKPSHADNFQAPDDAHKGSSYRPSLKRIVNGVRG